MSGFKNKVIMSRDSLHTGKIVEVIGSCDAMDCPGTLVLVKWAGYGRSLICSADLEDFPMQQKDGTTKTVKKLRQYETAEVTAS